MYDESKNDYRADAALAGSEPPRRRVAICILCDDDIDLEWEKHLEIEAGYVCARCMSDICEEVENGPAEIAGAP